MSDSTPLRPVDTDRNLLFGVLALQADLINNTQLAEACAAWAARKTLPLADVLVERGWLTAADKAHVEYLLERTVRKHGGNPKASLGAVAQDAARRALVNLDDAEARQSLAGPVLV